MVLAASILAVSPVQAQEFGWIGARSAAMGGTGVALADDSAAVHFNPAGLAIRPHADTVIALGGFAHDQNELVNSVERLGQVNREALAAGDPEATAAARADILSLAQDGTGLDGGVSAGLFLTQNGGGISLEGLGWVAVRPSVDLVHLETGNDPARGIANNTTTIHFRGLETREAVGTYSIAIIPALLSVGVNLKYVKGTTYASEALVFDVNRSSRSQLIRDALDKNSKSTNRFSYDLGVLFTPIEILRVGATARYVNSPKFRTFEGGTIRLDRQVRIGAAFTPSDFRQGAITADVDLFRNQADLKDRKTRFAGVGGELRMGALMLRAGARTDLEEAHRTVVPTAGIGFSSFSFNLDVAAAYRKDRDADVELTLRWNLPN